MFEKQDLEEKIMLYGGPGEVTIMGTLECGNCHAVYQVRDIYEGKHDLPRQHWAEVQARFGGDMEIQ